MLLAQLVVGKAGVLGELEAIGDGGGDEGGRWGQK